METPLSTPDARAWNDRLAGRVPFDPSAAEAAIRGAYRASDLAEPRHVLWAAGPREAAQAIAFLETPPRSVRRTAFVAALLGAVGWALIARAVHDGALVTRTVIGAGILSIIFAGFTVYLGAWRSVPVPPPPRADRKTGRMLILSVILFLALAGFLFVVQRFGAVRIDPALARASIGIAALLGAMPGLLLRLRMRHAYARLSTFLRDVSSPSSVAREIERERDDAWAPYHRITLGARPDQSLAEAYRAAHAIAALSAPPLRSLEHGGTALRADTLGHDRLAWATVHAGRGFQGIGLVEVPAHLDGIQSAARAAMVERAGAEGPAIDFIDLAYRVDRVYPYSTIAIAVHPAPTVNLDPEGRPHGEDGPALQWADGTRIFAWHGQLVPPTLIEEGAPVGRSRIARERDPLHRSVLIERYGLGRYLLESGASEIDAGTCGRLYRLPQHWNEPIVAVRVVNHTPEPDGSFREFWLRVPPTIVTARQAVAWTFDLPLAEYDPVAES